MNNVTINLTFDLQNKNHRDNLAKIVGLLSNSPEVLTKDATEVPTNSTKQRNNNPKGINTQILQKERMKQVVDILSSMKGRGAFIFSDLYKNRNKYGLNVASCSSIYKVVDNLVKDGKATILTINNPNSNNTNTMQEYVQLI